MRFDANFLVPEDTRKFLGVESSAVYAHSLSQYQSSSQQVNAPPQPQIQPQQQQQHECIKRKNDDVEDVTAKRLKMDQPDLQEQYWAFEMRMMRS